MTAAPPPPPQGPDPGRAEPPPGLVAFLPSWYPAASRPADAALSPAARPGPLIVATPTRPLPVPAGVRRRAGRQIILAVSAVIVLVLAATAVIAIASATPPPTTEVRALFTALTQHNWDALRTLNVCDDSPLCETGALTSGYQPPQHPQIDTTPSNTDSGGDYAVVTVHYDIDGTGHTEHVGLTRYRQGILGHQWRITTPPGTRLQLHSSYWDTAHLANTDIPTTTEAPATTSTRTDRSSFWAPPGRYTLTTRDDPLVNPTRLDLTVAGDQPAPPITLTPTVRPDLTTQIDQQIHTRIDQCAAQHTPHPAVGSSPLDFGSCPFRDDPPYTVVDSPHWTIQQYPTIALHPTGSTTIAVTTTVPGQAELDYRWTLDIVPPQRWTTAATTMPITIGGHVELDQNTPTWKP